MKAGKGSNGVVVSYDPVASAIGSRILLEGGNAIDAAVATGMALAATYPQAGALGGGGFMILSLADGGVEFLDYRETAPKALSPDVFIQSDGRRNPRSVLGAMSVGVPGTVAGFAEALERYGTMPWERVVSPTIELAEAGVWLTTRQAAYMSRYADDLSRFGSTSQSFLASGEHYLPGTIFRQPDLGRCLRILASGGPREFYEGSVANLIVDEIKRDDGVLSMEDLAEYRAVWRKPLATSFRDREIFTAGFPSGGGLVIHFALQLLEQAGFANYMPRSLERYELLGRCFRVGFAIRHRFAADPDFLNRYEAEAMQALFNRSIRKGDLERFESHLVDDANTIGEPLDRNTTHYAVLDRHGNAVSNTYSLNTLFGSKLAVSGAGFLLNNSIDDFRIGDNMVNWYGIVDGPRNELMAGRRPVGSMAPTIVRKRGSVFPELVLGGSGGPTIPTLVTQSIIGVLLDHLTLAEAIDAPRIHHQYRKAELLVEDMVESQIFEQLETRGQDPVRKVARLGIGAGIECRESDGRVLGALDKRFGHYAHT